MRRGKGKITTKKSGKGGYESTWLYIPSKLVKDSSFPFTEKEEVSIQIEDGSLIIKKRDVIQDIIEAYGIQNATLPKLIEDKANENGERTFLYFKDKKYSYMDMHTISNQIGNGLLKVIENLNLKKPKIALMLPNCPDFIFSWFGIIKAGSTFVPINTYFKPELLQYQLNNSNSRILIIDYQYLRNFKKISSNLPNIEKIIVRNAHKDFTFDDKYIDFQEIISANMENPDIDVKHHHIMAILYTPGTTGKPKGVIFRNSYVISGIYLGKELESIGLNKYDRIYNPIPLFYILGNFTIFLPAYFYNASIIISENFQSKSFWEEILKYKATAMIFLGDFLSAVLKTHQLSQITDKSHSVKWAFGFGIFHRTWKEFEKRYGIPIYHGWSQTESMGITINKVGSKGGKIGSIGKPLSGYEIKIVDSRDNELPPGPEYIGEIVCRSVYPSQLQYHNLTEEGDTLIDKGRWYHSGDIGFKDKDGFIYYKGRKSNLMRINGEAFFAREIENVANSHPLIIESACFTVPNEDLSDEVIKLCAVPKNHDSITQKELYDYLKQHLMYFMFPKYIEFKDTLPKSLTKAVQKQYLKQEWNDEKTKKNTWDARIKNYILT